MKKLFTLFAFTLLVFIAYSQNVGIGTKTPNTSALLDISSTTKGLLLPRMTTIQRNSIVSPVAGLMIYDTDRKSIHHYDGSSWRMILNNDYWNRVTEKSNYVYSNLLDSIGIGLFFAPTARLDVAGNIRSRRNVIVDSNVTAAGTIKGDGLISTAGLLVGQGSILAGSVFGNSTATFSGLVSSNTGMAIIDAAGTFTFKNGTEEKGFAQLSGDDFRVGTFSTNTAGKFHIRTGGSNNLTVTGDGRVGIGTSTPAALFHVAGRGLFKGTGEVLAIDGTSNPNIAFYNNGTYKSFISQSSSELFIGVNNAKLHLDATQIAIGGVIPAASAYKLTVTGKIICEELKVQLQGAWPDYVFKKEYGLMPMDELREFISENNHLPNIPAAATMERDGMEVGELQRRMMEKIEELTLYVLQLEAKVNMLSKK